MSVAPSLDDAKANEELRSGSLHAAYSAPTWNRMLTVGKRLQIAAGDDCGPSGSAGRILVVLAGTIRVYLSPARGSQMTLCYLGPGETVFCQGVAEPAFRLAALRDVHALEFSSREFGLLIQRDSALARAVAHDAHRHQELITAGIEIGLFGTVRQRVIQHILCMLSGEPEKSVRGIVNVTQIALADAAGTAREVVGRVLRELHDEGCVGIRRGKLHVRDPLVLHQELRDAFPDASRILFPSPVRTGPAVDTVDQRRWP